MTIHIGGLSSGTDYQSLVDSLVEAQTVPIQTKQAKLDEIDYDMGAWDDLSTLAEDLTSSLDTLRSYDLWHDMGAVSTYESVATATANSSASEQTYTLVVSNQAAAQSMASNLVDTTENLIGGGYASSGDSFMVGTETVTIAADETLSSLRTKINDAAVEMSDETRFVASIIDDRLVLTREQTGAQTGAIADELADVSGMVLQNLGVLTSTGAIQNENVVGVDAHFSVNGLDIVRSSNTELSDVIEGATLTLFGTGTTTLTVSPDRDSAKEAILDFVEKYNTFAEQSETNTSIAMGSSSSLVQKGELYGDSLMTSIDTNIRSYATSVKSPALNETNAGYMNDGSLLVMDALNDIGIWTTSDDNNLELVDEDALDNALNNEFDLVAQLFKGTYDEEEIAYTNGIASDFYSYMSQISDSLTGDIAVRLEVLTEDYDDLSDEIDEMTDALDDYEQDQWDIFTEMEDALASMNSQLDYISSVFDTSSD